MSDEEPVLLQQRKWKHPECRAGEVFLGNNIGSEIPDYLSKCSTLRLGDKAFDINRQPLDEAEGIRPLFISTSEAGKYDRIMTERTSLIKRGLLKTVKP